MGFHMFNLQKMSVKNLLALKYYQKFSIKKIIVPLHCELKTQ